MINYLASFVNTDGAAFPDTQAVNVTAPGAGDGTEFVAIMVNDIWGRAQALLDYAGLTPDGVTEAPDTAQVLDAIGLGFSAGPGTGRIYWKNDTPAVHGDRLLLLQGQVILIATYPLLVAATYCGDPDNPTAPAFYKTSDAGGTIRNTAGTYFVLPDTRGLSLKNIGDATISGRTKTGPVELGEVQEDQMQGHWHEMNNSTGAAYIDGAGDHYHVQEGGGALFGLERTGGGSNQGTFGVDDAKSDGVNGTPRTGDMTRDATIGTNFGIVY